MQLAEYLLENIHKICGKPPEEKEKLQKKLLCATNVKGYTALSMQDLWNNEKMKNLLMRYYPKDVQGKEELSKMTELYIDNLLLKIASPQALTEKLIKLIDSYLYEDMERQDMLQKMDALLNQQQFNINNLGSTLSMTPLIYTITYSKPSDAILVEKCYTIAKKLLDNGAKAHIREKHPMGVGAVIRASVTNNFKLLRLLCECMDEESFKTEINAVPSVNGLTAMHDAVHRALTAPNDMLKNHLEQIEWMPEKGARTDIYDNTGQSAYQLAEYAKDKSSGFPIENAQCVWNIIKNTR